MAEPVQNFRTAFHGFNREDVVRFLETATARHTAEVNQLQDDVARLEKEREKCQSDIDFIGRKLDNPGFVAKAPAQLIETERAKLAQHKERMAKILESIAAMRK